MARNSKSLAFRITKPGHCLAEKDTCSPPSRFSSVEGKMKKGRFLWVTILAVTLMLNLLSCSKKSGDLTRKEAERLYLAAYPHAGNEPYYIFFTIGKWVTPFPAPMGREKDVYIKLQQLGLISFSEKEGGWHKEYDSEVTEKGKSEITEVTKEHMKNLNLPNFEGRKWYKIKMFNVKFGGCTGVRNFIEKKEAIADFSVEFVDRTKTFSAISGELKKFLSAGGDPLYGVRFMKIFLRHDWGQKAIDDLNFKGTYSYTFDLYDDGWRIRKPGPPPK